MCRNTANNINFHLRSISVKIKDQISSKLKKKQKKQTVFGPFWDYFSNFGCKKRFSRKIWLLYKGLIRDSQGIAPCQNSKKRQISRKYLKRRKDGRTRTGRQTDPILQDPSGYCWGSENLTKILSNEYNKDSKAP